MSKTEEDSRIAKAELQEWLAQRGLEMSEEKTATKHLDEGFDFLGYNIRRYARPATKKRGFQVLIRPAKENISRVKDTLREVFIRRKTHNPKLLILEVNSIIRGWCLYYRHVSSSKTFNQLDYFLWNKCWKYAKRRHPQKNKRWIRNKYFPEKWRLQSKEGATMMRFNDFNFVKLPNLRSGASPDNPDEAGYWEKRRSLPSVGLRVKGKLWRRQKGLCELCKGILDTGEEIVIHHSDPKGPRHSYDNQMLVHETCHHRHHQRTA